MVRASDYPTRIRNRPLPPLSLCSAAAVGPAKGRAGPGPGACESSGCLLLAVDFMFFSLFLLV